jgi:hypothetical protein
MEVGAGRESGSQARSDRYPVAPRCRQRSALGHGGAAQGKRTRGGRKPDERAGYLGGEEGQESIGPPKRLTACGGERTLGRSKALKPIETAREQRVPKGATAGRVGKALKAEILRADVARNKATRPGRDETAERVRNPESGRYRRGKPVQRSPQLKRRKEPNPMGEVADVPRCARAPLGHESCRTRLPRKNGWRSRDQGHRGLATADVL